MCTVTFIPTSKNSFVLTSNRDEHTSRLPSGAPVTELINGNKLLFPKDGNAGGTWICASETGRVICLLNGAFTKHRHMPPYRKSRGLLALESFDFEDIEDFIDHYDFSNIEPFTMVIFETSISTLFELRWDGTSTYLKRLPLENHIWSSSPLYDQEIRAEREVWFKEWFELNDNSTKSIMSLHTTGGRGTVENNFNMKRVSGVQTVSVTQVTCNPSWFSMEHTNFVTNELNSKKLVIDAGEFV
ncbi:MAG: NRDE family protein [Flavobacteriales bacterium]|nr:NRDE family protein [Flavobacteriales bacterium]